jgi:hypothetical protein
MSAIDNLSTKCSGLLLRSSFAILAARPRHLFRAAPTPAFSVASISVGAERWRRTSQLRETVTPKRGNVPLARQPFTTTRVPLEPTPDGLGVKVIASTYQRRDLGLQSGGARCYNSQEFYG